MSRPIKIKNQTDAYRVRCALLVILGSLSTEDLKYLRDLKNGLGSLDYVGVVLDDIIKVRTVKKYFPDKF